VREIWRQSSCGGSAARPAGPPGRARGVKQPQAASQPAPRPLVGTEPPPRWRRAGRRWYAPRWPPKGCSRRGHRGQQIPQARGSDTAARWPLATSPRSPRRGHGAHRRSRAPRRKSPRATSERQRASQPAASSLVATQTPRISEVPLARAAGDDEHVDVRGPASLSHLDDESIRPARSGTDRCAGDGCERPSPPHRGCGPSCEIWDVDSVVIPRAQASFSRRRLETPSTRASGEQLVRATSERARALLESVGEVGALAEPHPSGRGETPAVATIPPGRDGTSETMTTTRFARAPTMAGCPTAILRRGRPGAARAPSRSSPSWRSTRG